LAGFYHEVVEQQDDLSTETVSIDGVLFAGEDSAGVCGGDGYAGTQNLVGDGCSQDSAIDDEGDLVSMVKLQLEKLCCEGRHCATDYFINPYSIVHGSCKVAGLSRCTGVDKFSSHTKCAGPSGGWRGTFNAHPGLAAIHIFGIQYCPEDIVGRYPEAVIINVGKTMSARWRWLDDDLEVIAYDGVGPMEIIREISRPGAVNYWWCVGIGTFRTSGSNECQNTEDRKNCCFHGNEIYVVFGFLLLGCSFQLASGMNLAFDTMIASEWEEP